MKVRATLDNVTLVFSSREAGEVYTRTMIKYYGRGDQIAYYYRNELGCVNGLKEVAENKFEVNLTPAEYQAYINHPRYKEIEEEGKFKIEMPSDMGKRRVNEYRQFLTSIGIKEVNPKRGNGGCFFVLDAEGKKKYQDFFTCTGTLRSYAFLQKEWEYEQKYITPLKELKNHIVTSPSAMLILLNEEITNIEKINKLIVEFENKTNELLHYLLRPVTTSDGLSQINDELDGLYEIQKIFNRNKIEDVDLTKLENVINELDKKIRSQCIILVKSSEAGFKAANEKIIELCNKNSELEKQIQELKNQNLSSQLAASGSQKPIRFFGENLTPPPSINTSAYSPAKPGKGS